MKQTLEELKRLQAQPLERKIVMTRQRVREWVEHYGEDGVYVSFSGGKDSTVLLDIVRKDYPNVRAVFVDTGLEYPEIRQFVKTFENVEWIKPKMNFKAVIEKYGYPFISKEVSESVCGAKKYLTSIIKNESCLTDRQTDRQTEVPLFLREAHRDGFILETESGKTCLYSADRESIKRKSRGGYDNKWRKVRGIGEYSKRKIGQKNRRVKPKVSNNVGVVNERQESSDKGEYP